MTDDKPFTARGVIDYLREHYYVPPDVALAALNKHRDALFPIASVQYAGDTIAMAMGWKMLPEPSVPGEGFWSWESQAKQHAERAKPGIAYTHHEVVIGTVDNADGTPRKNITAPIDLLLYYSPAGRLSGILCRYPETIEAVMPGGRAHVLEAAGNVSMWVKPSRRRRGIGMALLDEAERRWSPDWFAMTFTNAGHALIRKHLRENPRRFHDDA